MIRNRDGWRRDAESSGDDPLRARRNRDMPPSHLTGESRLRGGGGGVDGGREAAPSSGRARRSAGPGGRRGRRGSAGTAETEGHGRARRSAERRDRRRARRLAEGGGTAPGRGRRRRPTGRREPTTLDGRDARREKLHNFDDFATTGPGDRSTHRAFSQVSDDRVVVIPPSRGRSSSPSPDFLSQSRRNCTQNDGGARRAANPPRLATRTRSVGRARRRPSRRAPPPAT